MYVSVRASRVVVGGFDYMSAIDVGVAGTVLVPLLAGLASWGWGWSVGFAFVVALLGHAVATAGCRFRLVADARGCVLWRTWYGVPWSRRALGRRASVASSVGWDWEELLIVPEHPRDDEDRFVVIEAPPGAWTAADIDAFAAVADREIARVVAEDALPRAGTYRTAYPRG